MYVGKYDENGNPVQFEKAEGIRCPKCGGQMYIDGIKIICEKCFHKIDKPEKKQYNKITNYSATNPMTNVILVIYLVPKIEEQVLQFPCSFLCSQLSTS